MQKIHACPNDCILYRGDQYEDLNACPVCGALRYKISRDDPGDVVAERPRKKINNPIQGSRVKELYICMPEIWSSPRTYMLDQTVNASGKIQSLVEKGSNV